MMRLTIHESLTPEGDRETVEVSCEDGALVVTVAGVPTALPLVVLERVMERYGKPLEDPATLAAASVGRIDLGPSGALHLLRHRAFYDVIARDFVVWAPPDREPLAELASGVSAALTHFVRAANAAR